MKFSLAAVAAFAVAGVSAHAHGNVTVTTLTVDQVVTYCPEATTIEYGDKTITVTAPGTITITDCPCTIVKPVIPTSTVICEDDCHAPPPVPTHSSYPPHNNGTIPTHPPTVPTTATTEGPAIPTGAAGKVAAGMAGLLGMAVLAL